MLKKALRDALVASAASLDTVPADEQVTIVAFLDYYPWEDPSGDAGSSDGAGAEGQAAGGAARRRRGPRLGDSRHAQKTDMSQRS